MDSTEPEIDLGQEQLAKEPSTDEQGMDISDRDQLWDSPIREMAATQLDLKNICFFVTVFWTKFKKIE
jgi:hypothetical protein